MNSRHVFYALGVLALTSAIAFAEQDRGKGSRGDHGGPWSFRALSLSQDQKDQVRALWRDGWDKMAPQRDQLEQLRRELHTEALAESPDDSKIQDLKQRAAALQSELLGAHVDLERRMATLLTPEQRQTLRSLPDREQQPGRHHGRWSRHGGAGTDQQ